jgi:hypothetical protein
MSVAGLKGKDLPGNLAPGIFCGVMPANSGANAPEDLPSDTPGV